MPPAWRDSDGLRLDNHEILETRPDDSDGSKHGADWFISASFDAGGLPAK